MARRCTVLILAAVGGLFCGGCGGPSADNGPGPPSSRPARLGEVVPGADPRIAEWLVPDLDAGTLTVDVEKATDGKAQLRRGEIHYRGDGMRTTFTTVGWYRGKPFAETYILDGRPRARLGPLLSPGDGIPDYYSLVRFEAGRPIFYLFADSDLVAAYPALNAFLQGRDETLADLGRVAWREVRRGAFVAQFPDDLARYVPGTLTRHLGGLFVTDATLAEFRANTLTERLVLKSD